MKTSKFKACYQEPTYVVNKKEVICHLTTTIINNNGEVIETEKFEGVAKCNDDDKFDFEVGKRIALAKAELKLHKHIAKTARESINYLLKDVEALEAFELFANAQIEHNNEYLKEERYLNYKKK